MLLLVRLVIPLHLARPDYLEHPESLDCLVDLVLIVLFLLRQPNPAYLVR